MNDETIKTAIARIKAGDDTEAVLRFIYNLGYTDGMLTMAGRAEEAVIKLLDAA